MKTNSSFDHAVWRLTPAELSELCEWDRKCRMPGRTKASCHRPTVAKTRYRYVTGRSGRVTTSDRYVCEDHAESFAEKRKVAIGDSDPYLRATDSARLDPGKGGA